MKFFIILSMFLSSTCFAAIVELRDLSKVGAYTTTSGYFKIEYGNPDIYSFYYGSTTEAGLAKLNFNNYLDDAKESGDILVLNTNKRPLEVGFLTISKKMATAQFYTEFLDFKKEVDERLSLLESN